MTININKAESVEYGLSLDDNVGIFEGTNIPSAGAGEPAPAGSLFIRTGFGELYQKFGSLDTEWRLLLEKESAILNDLADVTITSPSIGQFIKFDGSEWVNTEITISDLPLKLYAENTTAPTNAYASGTNSVAIGNGAESSSINSLAIGNGSSTRLLGQTSIANGKFTASGDAQYSTYIMRNITTDNTVTELFLDGVGGTQRLTMPLNSAFTFIIHITARRTDAIGGAASYKYEGLITRDISSASTTIVKESKTVIGETDVSWDTAVSADTTNGTLKITVTGQNGKTIRWVATINTIEVTN